MNLRPTFNDFVLAYSNIEVIMSDTGIFRQDFIELHQFLHRIARFIHVFLRSGNDEVVKLSNLSTKLSFNLDDVRFNFRLVFDKISELKADIVPVFCIRRAGISETNEEFHT